MIEPAGRGERPPLVSVAIASASALALEILLLRLFSITQWYHTAYMVISLALLGYGVSGSLLGWWGDRIVARRRVLYPTCLTAAGVAMISCVLLAQRIAVHPEQLLWSPGQIGRLTGAYLLLAVPFLLVATAVGMALMCYRPQSVYAGDLVGAGGGAVATVVALYCWHPLDVLRWIATLAVVAALVGAWEMGLRWRRLSWIPLAIVVGLWALPSEWTRLQISPYKALSQLLRVEGTRVVAERSSPLALVTAVESPVVPLRHAPGLSLAARREPPPQIALFADGEGPAAVSHVGDDLEAVDFLDQSTLALPYHLAAPETVLVLGLGGGEQVLRALRLGTAEIVAVELNRDVVDLLSNDFGIYSGRLLESPRVEVEVAEIRDYVDRAERRYDLVELAMGAGGQSGRHALSESYLHTVEAIDAYLSLLEPNGMLALTDWLNTPLRASVKQVATVVEVLRRRGVLAPERRLAVVRSWQTFTVLVKNGSFSTDEIRRLEAFCEARLFDVAFYDGMDRSAANRFNRLPGPQLHDAVIALLGPRPEEYLARSKFDLSPATDDRPFVHQYFRWRSLPEIARLKGRGGLPLLEASYLILVATLAQAALASVLLIGVPAWLKRRKERAAAAEQRDRVRPRNVVLYFGGLGIAFLLLEVALLQKFLLFLHHPVLAAAVVLTSFLFFAGIGSAVSGKLGSIDRGRLARFALALVGCIGLLMLAASGPLFGRLSGASTAVRVAAAVGLIAPLAFAMGMPFPLGLDQLRRLAPAFVPWAWGVNGCASVVSPVLATLLAVHFGFNSVVLIALAVYCATMLVFPEELPAPTVGSGRASAGATAAAP